jgi:hypothetical protein
MSQALLRLAQLLPILERARPPLGRLCPPKRILRALARAGRAYGCGVRSSRRVGMQLRRGAPNGSDRGLEHILLAIEQLLNVVGALLCAIGLLLPRVTSRLPVFDLRLSAFNTRGRTRASGLRGNQRFVEVRLFAVDPLLLPVHNGLLSIGDALIEIADRLLLLEAVLIAAVLLCDALFGVHGLYLLS